MSTSDDRPGHPGTEGEYPDRDVTDRRPPDEVGEYTERDTGDDLSAAGHVRPDDEGEYTDVDVADEHRHVDEEGSYTDIDLDPDPDRPTDRPERSPDA